MDRSSQNISVLVIEDEATLNAAYGRILTSAGITAEASFDGLDALSRVQKLDPDVILLDLKMPKMDGIEFLSRLSKLHPKPKAKVIIFSNYDKQVEIDEAFSLGAKKYMLKAWASPKELIKIVRETYQSTD